MCFGEVENIHKMFNNEFQAVSRLRCHIVMQCGSCFRKSRKPVACDVTRSGRPSILTEKKLLGISDCMLQSLKKSISKLSQHVGVPYGTAHTALKNTYAYTLTKLQPCIN
jgi:hypothetical protein